MQALGLVWSNLDPLGADLVEVRTPIAAPIQHGARLLLREWKARSDSEGFVVGRDVPSRSLACVLRNIALYEPLEGMRDFRVRLAGTAFMRRFGRDITGLKLSAIYDPENFEVQRANLAEVVTTKKPFICDVRVGREDRVYLSFEALRLPVFSPDRKCTWVMSGFFYSDGT